MSDLHNPLFSEEKEFLERKKLEYERALRGDVDNLKEKSVQVGRVAAVGAGLVGGIWLITKAFSRKKHQRQARQYNDPAYGADLGHDGDFGYEDFGRGGDGEQGGYDDAGAEYFTAGNGQRYPSKRYQKSAAESAQVFADYDQAPNEDDDLRSTTPAARVQASYSAKPGADLHGALRQQPSPYDPEDFEDDPFQDLPYDDSRRLPTSHAFDDDNGIESRWSGSDLIGRALQAFLKSDTGKMLVAQAAAVVLAMVTKKVSELFPADKNVDLASSPGYAPVRTEGTPAVSLASPDSPDASTRSSSI
ncbi:hypothetical protein IC235_21410 [Hymenobacter sp. BT664]|uniref:Uncharacterized protein n=1 Tax=Hymenobacter montanus TaxID=2771359 RepID=A0A927BGG5_9BACT|nr:hypothetical protein [Hymenobacter montanus]MBD2770451.1 hypothetical protein [Hymenobacter montanus]